MVVKRAALTAAVLFALFAAGCAAESPGSPGPSASGAPSPTPPAVAPTPSDVDPLPTYRPSPRPKGSLSLPAGTAKPGSALTLTLTGTVTGGVEGGCLLLDGYLLLNPNPRVVREGARITVTGEVRQDMATTCQQGTPFMIRTAEPA
jgi:hypothetical protein